ncbi:MAG: hypothetical protein J6X07_08945 [Prevotella sp.]|nr:hypothetical protein [Prevotella sp.]
MTQIKLKQDSAQAFERHIAFEGGIEKYVPVYFEHNGKKHFVINNVVTTKYKEEQSRERIDGFRIQLEANDGRYLCFYGKPEVWDFLKLVKTKGYTFENFTKLVICNSQYGMFYEFHGNLRECSYAFHYRIYDKRMFCRLRKRLPNIKIKDYTKEEEA